MTLVCKMEAIDDLGDKIMQFTEGNNYQFEKIPDPEGWEAKDDRGEKVVFFNPYIMFEKLAIATND